MNKAKLIFPELRGGPVQGLNDAGVENFQGAIDTYLARECAQNSLDAPRAGVSKVTLHFERVLLKPSEIPAFADLKTVLAACHSRWGEKPKEKEFFDQAIQMASAAEIPVLRISDYGTTGLTGSDTAEDGRWFALVKSQGVSNKGDTAGGSFGIGKSSPFAASRFRTVFYGTRTETGDVALQGVSRLVTHKNLDGKSTQGVGFIGGHDATGGEGGDPVFRAIRSIDQIPEKFRRTEPGTDIWVIGYRSGSDWSDNLIRSIIANFWPAIHMGLIEFTVGTKTIAKENLPELIERFKSSDFEAHYFYKAALNQPAKKTLKHVGQCELYLSSASADLPRKICMVRSSGMRIFDYAPRACRVPFSGLFYCKDKTGNKLLRIMEPPRHDIWDPKRVEGSTGKSALDEIKLWIREEVKKLNPLFSGDSFNESELAKYLPDPDPLDANELPQDNVGSSAEEDLIPKPKKDSIAITPLKARPTNVIPGDNVGIQAGQFGGPKGGRNDTDNGKGKGDQGNGTSGGVEDPKPPTLKVRSYSTSSVAHYDLILRTSGDFKGSLVIHAIGEDGLADPLPVRQAWLATEPATPLKTSKQIIEDLVLPASTPVRLHVELETPERRSIGASLMP